MGGGYSFVMSEVGIQLRRWGVGIDLLAATLPILGIFQLLGGKSQLPDAPGWIVAAAFSAVLGLLALVLLFGGLTWWNGSLRRIKLVAGVLTVIGVLSLNVAFPYSLLLCLNGALLWHLIR